MTYEEIISLMAKTYQKSIDASIARKKEYNRVLTGSCREYAERKEYETNYIQRINNWRLHPDTSDASIGSLTGKSFNCITIPTVAVILNENIKLSPAVPSVTIRYVKFEL